MGHRIINQPMLRTCRNTPGLFFKLNQRQGARGVCCSRALRLCCATPPQRVPYNLQKWTAPFHRSFGVRNKQWLTSTTTKVDGEKSESKDTSNDEQEAKRHSTWQELGTPKEYSVLNGAPQIATDVRDKHNETGVMQLGDSDYITVYHRPSKHLLNYNQNNNLEGVTLFLRQTNETIDLSFRKQKQMAPPLTDTTEEPSIQTVKDVQWKPLKFDPENLSEIYMKLAKSRLTGLVVVTCMGGYAMAPGAFHFTTFALCTLGTGLQSASANAINQYFEVPYDAQMNRTKNRPLVTGSISPLHAMGFAAVTGTAGLAILLVGVNPLIAGLGMANLLLYTMVYTPMKRLSIANTWLGSIVGAVPPMMGWAACTGQLDPGAWLLGAIMYAWQFPHFNALSWNLRQDYSRAGYRMTSVVNPALCKRVALRYCVGMVGLCLLAPVLDLTTWTFALDSLPLNLYLTYLGARFYRHGDSASSRKLFRFTLLHIPVLMVLMLISKKTFGEDGKKTPSGVLDKETVIPASASQSPEKPTVLVTSSKL